MKKIYITFLFFSFCLWGTGQPVPVQLDPNGSGPKKYLAPAMFKGELYFFAAETGSSASKLFLWRNNGSGPSQKITEVPMNFDPKSIVTVGELGFFAAPDALWVTDGTAGNTRSVKVINPTGPANISYLVAHKDKVFFTADNGTGSKMFVSDGTPQGTFSLSDVAVNPESPVSAGDFVYFIANPWDFQLWKTDGTTGQTVKVSTDFEVSRFGPKVFNGEVYFYGDDLITDIGGLFRLENNNEVLVKETGGESSFYVANNTLYFSPYGMLYKTEDGKTVTAVGSYSFYTPGKLGDKIIFQNNESSSGNGAEPWVTDGTAANTSMLKDINAPGIFFSYDYGFPGISPEVNGKVYFVHKRPLPATTGGMLYFPELFVTDGTPAGTMSVYAIDGSRYEVKHLRAVNNDFFFVGARISTGGEEKLYVIKGSGTGIETTEGNRKIEIYPNPADGTIYLKNNEGIARIFNLQGQLVMTSAAGAKSMDITQLPKGCYFLKILTDEGVSSERFVKN